jgi:hypothetical protein
VKYTVRLIYKDIIEVTDVEAESEAEAKLRAVDLLEETGGQVDYYLYDAEIRK